MSKLSIPDCGWQPMERAAFGLIYGAIVVLSLLMALDHQTQSPVAMAIVLFGSVLAISLAKMFAELLSHAIETGERILTRRALGSAWRHVHPTLSVANVPAALFLGAGMGWISVHSVVTMSQVYCILILLVLGARVGWAIGHGPWLSLGGALFAGALGTALAAIKYALH
jgi:hypothetical protein